MAYMVACDIEWNVLADPISHIAPDTNGSCLGAFEHNLFLFAVWNQIGSVPSYVETAAYTMIEQ
jgi:hypothetical protein